MKSKILDIIGFVLMLIMISGCIAFAKIDLKNPIIFARVIIGAGGVASLLFCLMLVIRDLGFPIYQKRIGIGLTFFLGLALVAMSLTI